MMTSVVVVVVVVAVVKEVAIFVSTAEIIIIPAKENT